MIYVTLGWRSRIGSHRRRKTTQLEHQTALVVREVPSLAGWRVLRWTSEFPVVIDAPLTTDRKRGVPRTPLAKAAPLVVDRAVVDGCLDVSSRGDALFERAWREGCRSLDLSERARVAGITGHVAESVVEVLLEESGWIPIWHHAGPGRHGVDLAFLSPSGFVLVVEVKGTLVPGRIPRLAHGELEQMSDGWVDKRDNPGMSSLGLMSEDVYGAVAAINFADLTLRLVATDDFVQLHPMSSIEELDSVP